MSQLGLHLQQKQSLVMNQQMQQSLKLLQMNNQELAEYLLQEMEQNPVLEQAEPGSEVDVESTDNTLEEAAPLALDEHIQQAQRQEDLTPENSAVQDQPSAEDTLRTMQDFGTGEAFDKQAFLQNIADERPDIRSHLEAQIQLDIFDPADQIIAMQLVDLLDDSGYFTADIREVARQLGVASEYIRKMILRLQRCDPVGIFATSLAECLELQLKDRDRFDPAMRCLVMNLDLIAKGDMKKLTKVCGVDEEDLRDMLKELRTLNPKPAAEFSVGQSVAVPPDVIVKTSGDGQYSVELNYGVLPAVSLNQVLYQKLKTGSRSDDDKKFITEKYQHANWLVRSVSQRSHTLLKVASVMMQEQKAFLEQGVMHIKALVLRDIAEKLELHESTIGRVIANKTIATPRGVYEMKYFFSSGINKGEGDDESVSSTAIKHRIKQLIDTEMPTHILADDALAELLNKENIPISRRTVAKYREAIGIPTSADRKRQKRNMLAG